MKQHPFTPGNGHSECHVNLSNEAYRRVQLYSIHWKTTKSELVDSLILKYLPPVQITFINIENTEDSICDGEYPISQDDDDKDDDDDDQEVLQVRHH